MTEEQKKETVAALVRISEMTEHMIENAEGEDFSDTNMIHYGLYILDQLEEIRDIRKGKNHVESV